MARGRKLHSNSFAARLSEEERDQLMLGLWHGNLSIADAAEKAADFAGRSVSETALSNWFHREQLSWRMEQARKAGELAEQQAPVDLDDRARAAIGYQKMVAMLGGELAPKDIVAFERNELARQKQELERERLELDRRKLALLERKAAQADEAKGVAADHELSAEEKSDRIKEIFGIR